MSTIINNLNWRYATKQYDTTKKISAEDLKTIQEAARLAPSAFGFQPFKIISVENPELRAKLREKSYGQPQVTDAAHLFVFAAQKTLNADDVDQYIKLMSETRNTPVEALQGYTDYLKGAVGATPLEHQAIGNARQAYIALGMVLTAAASLHIDASPMEGFEPAGYNEILGLTDHSAVVLCALGYRSEADATQHAVKVRKSIAQLFDVR